MPSKRPATTIKITKRLMRHIETKSQTEESVDATLRRLLRLKKNGEQRARRNFSNMMLIKVSRVVMDHIVRKSRPKESRDQTLGRLLGVPGDDGNVIKREDSQRDHMLARIPESRRNDGNVRVRS